jgi:hypothetical protein
MSLSSQKFGFGIPDLGVKKAPDPGSGTLYKNHLGTLKRQVPCSRLSPDLLEVTAQHSITLSSILHITASTTILLLLTVLLILMVFFLFQRLRPVLCLDRMSSACQSLV